MVLEKGHQPQMPVKQYGFNSWKWSSQEEIQTKTSGKQWIDPSRLGAELMAQVREFKYLGILFTFVVKKG